MCNSAMLSLIICFALPAISVPIEQISHVRLGKRSIDSSNTLLPEVKMEDKIVSDTNADTNVDVSGINIDKDQASEKNSDMSEITRVMQQTNKMLQMMMVINIGEDNFHKFSKIIDSGSLPEDSDDLIEEDSTGPSLSTVEECYKMQAYSEYRYSVFTQIKNEHVNNCVSNVLDMMVTRCAVFFLNDTKSEIEGQRIKYYLAVKLFDCYFFQPADESCANLSTAELLQCISKHPTAVQLTFHEYLDEIKPLCCHFKSYNESMTPIHEIITTRLAKDIPGIWFSFQSGFFTLQDLPVGICRKYWIVEAFLSQLAPFPFCFERKHFHIFQTWFLGVFVTIGAIIGWWKQQDYRSPTENNTFDSPFFLFTAPCIFQANLEILVRAFLYFFWPKFPSLIEHIIIIFTRYETLISLMFDESILRIFIEKFPNFILFLFQGMIKLCQCVVFKRIAEQNQAVRITRNRWENISCPLEANSNVGLQSNSSLGTPIAESTPSTTRRRR